MQTVEVARDRISAARRSTSIPFAAPTPERVAARAAAVALRLAIPDLEALPERGVRPTEATG